MLLSFASACKQLLTEQRALLMGVILWLHTFAASIASMLGDRVFQKNYWVMRGSAGWEK